MEFKDWLMLFVPVICNGVVVFFLQKFFEKKQTKRLILQEYYSVLRQKIDIGLELHAKATRLANEADINNEMINQTIQTFINSCLDVYYYYVQNSAIFSMFEKECQKLAECLMELSKGIKEHNLSLIQISNKINILRDVLQDIKKMSMR